MQRAVICWPFLGGKKAGFERGDETIRNGSHESQTY